MGRHWYSDGSGEHNVGQVAGCRALPVLRQFHDGVSPRGEHYERHSQHWAEKTDKQTPKIINVLIKSPLRVTTCFAASIRGRSHHLSNNTLAFRNPLIIGRRLDLVLLVSWD